MSPWRDVPDPWIDAIMFLAVLLLAIVPASATVKQQPTLDQLLDAIQLVETGGEPNAGRDATGDHGGALGPFQIHRAYWIDSGVPGRFEDCRDNDYARKVVKAYWKRWCPKALERVDIETLVRIHNGGPDGMRETCTQAFWKKVERELRRRGGRSR